MRLRLVPQDTNWDFMRYRKFTFGASVVAMVASLLIWLIVGLNFGIDFLGGTTIRTESTQAVDVGAYRAALEPLALGDVTITEVFDPTFAADQNVAQVRIQAQEGAESVTPETIAAVEEALGSQVGGSLVLSFAGGDLKEAATAFVASGFDATVEGNAIVFPENLPFGTQADIRAALVEIVPDATGIAFVYETLDFPSVESVGPKVSGELITTALIAVAASLAAILFYIWLRFEWQFSVGAVAALAHDVVLTIGVFSLLQIRFDLATIAAILTIIGYSINDTVVIFDRLRENLIKYKKTPLIDVMNRSVNETLSRTLMTSGTTLLALIALIALGGDVIRGFVFAILWGVIVGTYSSVYVAKNVVLMLGIDRDPKKPSDAGTQFADIDA
ncbi:protein translocase subunit SecF [Jannaschia sp.]|nr:protein translocase subunit SecF [Jannaschia sp.]